MKTNDLFFDFNKTDFNSFFQSYPAVVENKPRIDVFSIAENDETNDFIHEIIGVNFQSFDMAFSAKYGLRKVSSLIENYIKLHIKYNQPFEEYLDFNPFGENSKFYSISSTFITDLKIACGNRYGQAWKKLYNAFIAEYNVLKPYNVTVNDNSNDTLASNNIHESSGTDSNKTELDSENIGEGKDSIYGFNSRSGIPSDESENKNTQKTNSNNTGETTNNSKTNYTRDTVYERLLTREGNIGNQSSPELIEKEISLRKQLLWDIIVSDLAEFLTRQKYN